MRGSASHIILLLFAGIMGIGAHSPYNGSGPNEEAFKADDGEHNALEYILPSAARSGVIPFTRAGNLIIIQATVDSVTGNFILDTGAPGLVLNLTYFRYYKPSARPDSEGGGITGGTKGASPVEVAKLSFGGFDFMKVHAHRLGLGHIENQKGIKILGLLGAGLFKRFEMIIDHSNDVIYLARAGHRDRQVTSHFSLKENASFRTFPIKYLDKKVVIQLYAGKHKLNFVLDTGAETNVIDSRLPSHIMENVSIERKITLVGTGNRRIEAWYGKMKNLFLIDEPLGDQDFLVTSLKDMSAAFGRDIDGMLGYEFLSKQMIGFNFLTNQMYLWK
ncbi:MAG TPA: pepsin/retropepsin-like aspartic protease family protein [Phnomibacter sp.]|nr:pepsin/retropepsin-like aspartic protease family protein [Phnomibacter sp.]